MAFAHVLFATIEDAQKAHEHFHRAPLLKCFVADFWDGGPPVLPAEDMHYRQADGTYIEGRWWSFAGH